MVADGGAADGAALAGAMTHFATADERGDAFFGEQLARFEAWARPLVERHPGLIVHAANSRGDCCATPAATSTSSARAWPSTAWTRSSEDAAARDLEPALELAPTSPR